MKPWQVAIVLAVVVAAASTWAADKTLAPGELAGFEMGVPVWDFKDRLFLDEALPVRFAESMKEAEIRPIKGVKSGTVCFGTCALEGRITRIKLKYEDSSEAFYDKLYKRFLKRFGKPGEWRGDPFHVFVAWKWSFRDEKGHRISLILQHNTEDSDRKTGNAVKLTDWTLYEQEVACHKAALPSPQLPEIQPEDPWDMFLPK
ncbi:MAG: hypothetical protein KKA60_12790 [Proteobacteria bacterium]|nr:hypothetical protein [Pseudomonadota bacterium]